MAGGSAQAKYDQLSSHRQQRIRQAHPVLGGVILALTDEPQSTTAWARGAVGERRVGALLDGLAGDGVRALHDRTIPRGRANIDHLAIAPCGVSVIDAKRYEGQVAKKDVGGWFSTDLRLYVGRRDCTKLVAAMSGQVAAARAALGAEWADVPVHPLLCFVDAEWSWFAKPFTLDGVTITWPKATANLLRQAGPLTPDQVGQIADRLAQGLPQPG
ncbi:MAG: nuclease-related domain-containing protein [Acidimicrobiales bacterium]